MISGLRKFFSLFAQLLLGIVVLILIGTLPVLFKDFSFHFLEYIHTAYHVAIRFITFDHLTLDGKNALVPFIFDRYLYSMQILGLGIILAYSISFLLAYLGLIVFRKKVNLLKRGLELLEAVPDLIYILLLQMAVIIIFRNTGIKLAQVVSVQNKTVLLPVISISIPITAYLTKVLLQLIQEELQKEYVTLAKSKGLSFFYILNIHAIRNTAEGLFIRSKTAFWSMLSTLVVIDFLFNMNGLMRYMLYGIDPFIAGCILLFIPFFFLYRMYEWISITRGKGDS